MACFLGALYFWRLGNQWQAHKPAATRPSRTTNEPHVVVRSASTAPLVFLNRSRSTNALAGVAGLRPAWMKYRLSNTSRTVAQLTRSDRAILLETALIDTERPLNSAIPENLRAQGDPGSYIVQAPGPVDDAFRAALKAAGAEIVSYIPNNAFLVRAPASVAQQLAAGTGRPVIPFEPYYKLSPALLKMVMEEDTPADPLNVLMFPGESPESLRPLGTIVAEAPSPFGRIITLQGADAPALARLPVVERVEVASPRAPANDLSRLRVGVAADSVTTTDYLNLDGSNVVVQVNDTGVDATHPDLGPLGRVFGTVLQDTDGHGTHVAGIIAGNGFQSATVSNAAGSVMPGTLGQFRGMAPAARLFAQPLNLTDFELQTVAARTNVLISNNSWNYGANDYDIAAASYDAAVRDALPELPGSQPVLFVFAAGNAGNGSDNGLAGDAQSILSPATAKNVITVGAIEQPRGVTNDVVVNGQTNQPWAALTDADDEVASFSSRGNVGLAVEGENGRFKPDVVAPGVFVISTRSEQWNTNAYYNPTNYTFANFNNQIVQTNRLNNYSIFVPSNAVQVLISVFVITPTNVTDLPIYVRHGGIARTNNFDFLGTNQVAIPNANLALITGTTWFYSIGNPTNLPVHFNIQTRIATTNDNGNYFEVLQQLNDSLGGTNGGPFWYRYETSTSMSAADVSGVLALIQGFFTNTLQATPSPALLKAMLINGARSVNTIPGYDFQVNKALNYQGWGLIHLTNSVPSSLLASNSTAATIWTALTNGPSPLLLFDQDPVNALATGDSRTMFIRLDPSARTRPLRVSLVWTDPPGNPVAGVKLVNDLDLVITNLVTKQVFYGNDIQVGANFVFASDTNSPPNLDVINNVENVYLAPNLDTNYSITVIGRRVNVNAVTANPRNVAQDYALVLSSDSQSTNALKIINAILGGVRSVASPNITIATNEFASSSTISGSMMMNQHVGASSPLLGTNTLPLGTNSFWGTNGAITLGVTNQWHFYILTNDQAFTNAAFVTFLSPTLGLPRMGVTNTFNPNNSTRVEADIDLYVSRDPGLLTLDPNAVANAFKSLDRGGTEVITLSDAVAGPYYVGVKSEDQEAAEYAFFGVFSLLPFSTSENGVVTMFGINVPAQIPDGSPSQPGVTNVLAIAVQPIKVRDVIVTNFMTHQNFGDLLGSLSHNHQFAVLNNHSFPPGSPPPLTNSFVYEDNGEGVPGAQRTDGPGSLRNFVGETGTGLWLLTEVDNSLTHTGRVEWLTIRLEPSASGAGTNGIDLTVPPNSFAYDAIDVPPEATNLTISVVNQTIPPLPVQLYVLRGDFPTTNRFDYVLPIDPNGVLSINGSTFPPLQPGRYFIGIFNPNNVAQTVHLTLRLDLSLTPIAPLTFSSGGPVPIKDDAVSYSAIDITNDFTNIEIARAAIGVAIDHPRVSDLVLTLISPGGKRLLLFEERGGPGAADLGMITTTTNFLGQVKSGDFKANTNVITPIPASGALLIDYDFLQEPDTLDVFYGVNDIFSTGFVSGAGQFFIPFGTGTATDLTIIMNKGGNTNNPTTIWSYTPKIISQNFAYLTFTDNTNFSEVPIKFAIPPFAGTNGILPNVISDFEVPAIGTYAALTNVDGWAEVGNLVRVVNSTTPPAYSGSQYLQLLNGTISRVLPTRAGNTYTLSFWYNGSGSATVTIPGVPPITINGSAGGGNWQNITIPLGTRIAPTPVLITATRSGLLLDHFTLTDFSNGKLFYYPEEPLKPLVGENPHGTWLLEVRDARVGAASGTPPPEVINWQLQFNLATNTFIATGLNDGLSVTSTIAPCQFAYFSVEVPPEADFATNILIAATGPVNVWFNQTNFPTGTNQGDFELITNSTTGSATLFTNGIPPLIPGGTYYLGVQNPCASTSNVTFVLRVDFGIDIITLENMVPYANTNAGTNTLTRDYYHFVVPDIAARAQFEIDNPSGDLTLVVRKGLPLPDFNNFQFISANPGLNDELIVVFTNSTPIPLTAGNWYLTAINVSGGPVAYSIVASWWPTTGLPIDIIGEFFSTTNSFCITWTSLPGVHYYIQGVPSLGPGMTWTTVFPDILGTTNSATTTECVPLPTPYRFFRVVEGIQVTIPPPVLTLTRVGGGNLLQWAGPISGQYQVQWTSSLSAGWITLPTVITSNTGQFSFLDDGSQTGGLNAPRFYRLLILP